MSGASMLALIPAYNEAPRIAAVVAGARAHLPVLAIDDGSRDETAAVAEDAGATVLHQVPNQGKGAALRAGLGWALEHGYAAVLTLDADGQHDPTEIPAFLARHAVTHADLLIGCRDFGQMPLSRRVANTLGRWSFSWALGQRVEDNQSGYRLLSRRMAEAVLDSQEQGFEFEVEMIVTCVQRGYILDWIPIRTIYGDHGSHIDPWTHMRNWVRIVRQTWRTVKAGRQVDK
jgi:glycosyltransferase involved in cell wall biosynthesis